MSDVELMETIEDARMVLGGALPSADAVTNFARSLVQIADKCVVGMPCDRHGGAVHGREAEELRSGIEQILRDHPAGDDLGAHIMHAALLRLLDEVDARDSLVFLESESPKE